MTNIPPRRGPFRSPGVLTLGIAGVVGLTALVGGSWAAFGVWQERSLIAAKTAARERRDWPAYQQAAAQWRERRPDSVEALLELAEAAQRNHDLETMVASFEAVPANHRNAIGAWSEAVDACLSGLQQPLRAAALCRRILEKEPAAGRAHQRLIFFYSLTLQRQLLTKQIREAIARRCEPRESYPLIVMSNGLLFSDGWQVVRNWLPSAPDDENLLVAAALHRAWQSPDNPLDMPHQPLGYLDGIDYATKKYPANVEILSFNAARLQQAVDVDGVRNLLAQLPAENLPQLQSDSRIARCFAWVSLQDDDFAAAAKHGELATQLDPYDWQARFLYSEAVRRLRHPELAVRQADLSMRGKMLEKKLTTMAKPNEYDRSLLQEIADYASQVGDEVVAAGALARLAELPVDAPAPAVELRQP